MSRTLLTKQETEAMRKKVRRAIDRSGVSVWRAARMAGLDPPHLYRILNGKPAVQETFDRVIEALASSPKRNGGTDAE